MRIRQPEKRYFPRGPQIIPKPDAWQYDEYKNGRRFFEPVLPGQRFPEGASPKELDRLAHVRAAELAQAAAEQAVADSVVLEQPTAIPIAA